MADSSLREKRLGWSAMVAQAAGAINSPVTFITCMRAP